MTLFGIQIDLLLLLQLVVTGILITGYYLYTLLRLRRGEPSLGDEHMVLLSLFVLKNNRQFKTQELLLRWIDEYLADNHQEETEKKLRMAVQKTPLEAFVNDLLTLKDAEHPLPHETVDARVTKACSLVARKLLEVAEPRDGVNRAADPDNVIVSQLFWTLRYPGHMHERENIGKRRLGMLLLLFVSMLLAPLGALFYALLIGLRTGLRGSQILINTSMREWLFGWGIVLGIANVMVLFIDLKFLHEKVWWISLIVSGSAGIGIGLAVLGLYFLLKQQGDWKDFWQDRLLEVMALAESQGNHDLFNRAMILKNHIDAQPDIPVAGDWKFITVVYAGAQAILLWMARFF